MEAMNAPDYKEAARKLWMLLDDIDTLDDACRADDAAFRKHARETQRRRFAILSGEQMDSLLRAALEAGEEPFNDGTRAGWEVAAPVEARPVAWRHRKKNWDNSFGQPTWGDWRLTEHKPQAPSSDVFQVEPLYASPAAATQGDAPQAVAGSDGWSSDQPNADGLWLWREVGKDHVITLRLCSDGAEVDDAEEGESEDSYQAYWMRTSTDQRNMPGMWKRAAIGAESEQATEDGRNG